MTVENPAKSSPGFTGTLTGLHRHDRQLLPQGAARPASFDGNCGRDTGHNR
jgi:hypothetical protein